MKKSAIAIFAAALLMLSVVSMFYTTGIVIASPGDDYATIMGVLASDYFSLYPYETQSLDYSIQATKPLEHTINGWTHVTPSLTKVSIRCCG
jgi:hypothetical protein